MATKKSGLGKGLDSLITNKVNTNQLNHGIPTSNSDREPVSTLRISQVEPNREQPRKYFNEDGLAELADSIRQYGIIQPLIVQDKKDYYEIIAGERRWRAAKMAGLKEVPVIIRDISDREIMEMSLIENIQREDLNPIEEARAYQRLLEEFGLKQEEVANRVSKSRTAVTNALRLLKLCEEVQQMVIDGRLTNGHARCLISIETPEGQIAAAKQIIERNLSVRETEKLVKSILKRGEKAKQKKKEEIDETFLAICDNIVEQMKQIFGTKVEIHQKNRDTGKIEIEYYSQDELDRILQMVQSIEK
ncbi:MAG: ParB/RepB/Spo0J family partition protein [Clostridiales bacterium]|nr:ParB/RepB/Spo0J family partition protein [Clostridiales bacterium]